MVAPPPAPSRVMERCPTWPGVERRPGSMWRSVTGSPYWYWATYSWPSAGRVMCSRSMMPSA
ncbi:hypothetical protein D3C72_859850 [compost metagenome]